MPLRFAHAHVGDLFHVTDAFERLPPRVGPARGEHEPEPGHSFCVFNVDIFRHGACLLYGTAMVRLLAQRGGKENTVCHLFTPACGRSPRSGQGTAGFLRGPPSAPAPPCAPPPAHDTALTAPFLRRAHRRKKWGYSRGPARPRGRARAGRRGPPACRGSPSRPGSTRRTNRPRAADPARS